MNYIDLIPSKDIKEHLNKIGYKATIEDAFWLIYRFASNEKERASFFERMISEYTDEKVEYEKDYDKTISSSYNEIAKKITKKENLGVELDAFLADVGIETIPTPFKQGDIVTLNYDKNHPILLIDSYDYAAEADFSAGYMDVSEYKERMNGKPDYFNEKFSGCRLWDDGKIIAPNFGADDSDAISSMGYLSLEYYNKNDNIIDITILENIKQFIEKKMPIDKLLNYYKFG